MNGLFAKWCRRRAAFVLPVLALPVLALVLWQLPVRAEVRPSSQAEGDFRFLGETDGGVAIAEGDPLDGNDTGGGDVPDPRYIATNDRVGSALPSPVRFGGRVIYLVPVLKGGSLTFQIWFIATADAREG